MCILHYQCVTIILFVQVIGSFQKDIALHYPNRVHRCDEESDEDTGNTCSPLNILAQIVSLIVFVFYILIIFGLIKACLGLCCSPRIGEMGLSLVTDQEASQYNRNTMFCLNVVFFLVLPFALTRNFCSENSSDNQDRMAAGAEKTPIKSEIITSEHKQTMVKAPKKKKIGMDVYRDENDSETQDTKYVLEQLHRSEQSLRSGVYGYATITEQVENN